MHQGLVHRVPHNTMVLRCQMYFSSQETTDIDRCWRWGSRLAGRRSVPLMIMLCFWGTLSNPLISLQEWFDKCHWYYLLWIFRGFLHQLFLDVSLLWSSFFSFSLEIQWLLPEHYKGIFLICLQWEKQSKIWSGSGLNTVKRFFVFYAVFFFSLVLILWMVCKERIYSIEVWSKAKRETGLLQKYCCV